MPPSSAYWDTSMIPSLEGKVIIVTGANANLGYETALQLALAGGQVILACRHEGRGKTSQHQIQEILQHKENCHGSATYMHLDVGNLESIHSFTQAFLQQHQQLDLLINNAGVKAIEYATTVDGFESQFGINHLGHFALTSLLMDALKRSPESRIVHVSSISHHYVSLDFDNLNAVSSQYDAMDAYRKSKLATMLFAYELDRRLKCAGITNVRSIPCHPGVTESNLLPNLGETYQWAFMRAIVNLVHMIPFAQSNAMGALCVLNAATDRNVEGGEFIGPHGWIEFYGYPRVVKSSIQSYDEEAASKLWTMSEKLTKVAFVIE